MVSLTALRPQVGGHRAAVDAALIELSRQRVADLEPESDQKTLTDADRAAALWMGNQDKHLIAID